MPQGRGTLAFIAAVLLIGGVAQAQTTTGNLVGTVTDNTGAILPGAKVSLRGEAIVGTQTTVTNERGFYRFVALPPGSYELKLSFEGFSEVTQSGLRVLVGQTTENNVALKLKQASEEVTVVGESSAVDPQSTQLSTNYDKDWIRNSPMNRNSFFDLINSAPGIATAAPTSAKAYDSTAFGSSTTENTYMMDGTDLTAPYDGAVWPLPNTDAIEEIQVLSLGAPAEYGNLQGAVFNVVTRQGSNSFHGDANFYFQHQNLTSNNASDVPLPDGSFADSCPDPTQGRCPYHRFKYNDTTLQLSGPIVKDKLWFFAAYENKTDQDSQPGTDPKFPIDDSRWSVLGKVNYQISPRHKLMVSFHEDYYHLPYLVTANTSPSSVTVDHGWSPAPNVTYTAVVSDKTYIEARYAGFYGSDHGDPVDGSARTAKRYLDLASGKTTGGIYDWYDGSVPRTGVSAKVSHFADRFLGGSHDFKFGVQYTKGGADYVLGYNDYIYLNSPYGYTYGYTAKPYHTAGEMRSIAGYFDDTYRLSARLTLNLGLRYDNSQASYGSRPILDANGNPTGQVSPAVSDLFTWNVVSPRVGFVWKVTPDGKSLVKGHYGRYYRAMITSEFDPASPSIAPRYLFSGSYDASGNPIGLTLYSSNSNLKIDPHMRDPHTDQFIGSFEQEVARNLAMSLTYVHKKGTDFAGWADITGQYTSAPFVDNVSSGNRGDQASGQTILVQQLVSDPTQRIFLLTNPAGLSSTYDGGVFGVTKRMSDHWQLTASIVVSKSQGRIASSIPVNPENVTLEQTSTAGVYGGTRPFGRNPNNYINTNGLLLADRPIALKAQFLYELPAGFLVGVNYAYVSGRPWARELDASSVANIPGTIINAEPLDGSRRVANLSLLDIRAQKSFPLGKGVNFAVFADGLNVLNSGAAEGVLSQVAGQTTFGLPSNFTIPRRLMLGAKLQF